MVRRCAATMRMEFFLCEDAGEWRATLECYGERLKSFAAADKKLELVELDEFYRNELPGLFRSRDPVPFITRSELCRLLQWKLSRGKWRPRLLDFVSNLDEEQVELVSRKAFAALPDLNRAVSELTVLKGVGPATASAVLAAYAPDVAPFMSDEAMVAAMGGAKEYTLKQYLTFAEKLQSKAKELSKEEDSFTPSDVERAIWSSSIEWKLASSSGPKTKRSTARTAKRRRNQ